VELSGIGIDKMELIGIDKMELIPSLPPCQGSNPIDTCLCGSYSQGVAF